MVARALAALALAGGCAGGVEVIVEPPSTSDPTGEPVASVRLFVGEPASFTPNAITPMGAQPPDYSGDVYALDAGGSLASDHLPARFSFERGTGGMDSVGTFVAVGYDDHGAPIAAMTAPFDSIMIPTRDVVTVEMVLDPADALPSNGPFATAGRVEVWGGGDGRTCAYNQNDDVARARFVVLDDDVDCDTYANNDPSLECLPTVYDGTRGPNTIAEMSCIAQPGGSPSGGSSSPFCQLGGPPCIDGRGQTIDPGCFAGPYCVPTADCAVCPTARTVDELLVCAVLNMGQPGAATYQQNGLTNAGTGAFTACAGQAQAAPLFATTPIGCADGQIAAFDPVLRTWMQSVVIDGITYQFDIDSQCRVTIGQTSAVTIVERHLVVVAVNLANGRGLVMPIVIAPTTSNGCSPVGALSPAPLAPVDVQCLMDPPLPGGEARSLN